VDGAEVRHHIAGKWPAPFSRVSSSGFWQAVAG
jgi:hypothetical protein